MKLVCFIFFLFIVTIYGQDENSKLADEVDHNVYKTYKTICYKNLPKGIKLLMKESNCGEIGAVPSQENDYKTNYDVGYVIDLNDDGNPEYVFSCEAPSHGAGIGNIYSLINGKWQIIGIMSVFENPNPEINIKVLKTKNEGFRDLISSSSYNYRDVIVRYINGEYYVIHYSDEIVRGLLYLMNHYSNENLKNCYFGISNSAKKVMWEISQNHSDNYEIFYYAAVSSEDAQKAKDLLLEKGFNFIDEYNDGQIIFCYTKKIK